MALIKKLGIISTVLAAAIMNSGCAIHHTQLRSSFVKVNVSTNVEVCGRRGEKTSECVDVMELRTSGSGAIVENKRTFGGSPRTLVMTANHVCIEDVNLPPGLIETIKEVEEFRGEVQINSQSTIQLIDSYGRVYKVNQEPWVRNEPADLCIVETSINAPSLNIAAYQPEFADFVLNIAAPAGFMKPSSSGGAVFVIDGRYSGTWTADGYRGMRPGTFSVYTLWAAGGSSGSPILNRQGEVVGMVSAVFTSLWPRVGGAPVLSAPSPLTISPTLQDIQLTIQEAKSAMERGEPFVFRTQLNVLYAPQENRSEEDDDTGDIITYPIHIDEMGEWSR